MAIPIEEKFTLTTENSIYISSFSSSNNFPTSVNAFQNSNMGGQDAVVFKFNNDVSVLEWSTYIRFFIK